MSNESASPHNKLLRFAEFLWQAGFLALVIGVPIGASQGYTNDGMGGMARGAGFAFALAAAVLLAAFLLGRFATRGERQE